MPVDGATAHIGAPFDTPVRIFPEGQVICFADVTVFDILFHTRSAGFTVSQFAVVLQRHAIKFTPSVSILTCPAVLVEHPVPTRVEAACAGAGAIPVAQRNATKAKTRITCTSISRSNYHAPQVGTPLELMLTTLPDEHETS